MSVDEQPPAALPKLYGAPAYARPPAPVAPAPRPPDRDQFPLQAFQTEEELEASALLPVHAYLTAPDPGNEVEPTDDGASRGLRPRLFNLRAIAGRLLGGDRSWPG